MEEQDLWWVFIAIIIVMLAADLWFNRKSHHIPFKTAVIQTVIWISIALLFGALIFWVTGDTDKTLEYYTAYAIEEAMSMDNLFVFIIIFAYFGIRDEDQHKALFYGVIGAIVFRAIFIFVGSELISMFHWILYIFGFILLVVALKTLFGKEDNSGENKIAKFMKERFNYVDSEETRGKLIVKIDGKRVATVLLLCIIVIELSDIVFALDSIPAVLAISQDTLVIYTSNIFAVMGLRSLFFVIHGGMTKIRYLKYGLGFILLFVALKLLLEEWIEVPVVWSLVIIILILVVTIVASVLKNRSDRKKGIAPPPEPPAEPPADPPGDAT